MTNYTQEWWQRIYKGLEEDSPSQRDRSVWVSLQDPVREACKQCRRKHPTLETEVIIQEFNAKFLSKPEQLLHGLRSHGTPAAFLATVCSNLATDLERKKARDPLTRADHDEQTLETVIEKQPTRDFLACAAIGNVVDTLEDPEDRELLHRRYYDGQALDEIAADMHLGLSAIKMRLSRLLALLRRRREVIPLRLAESA
jgi:RNA polymerase sigma factor (sigma-70 family)